MVLVTFLGVLHKSCLVITASYANPTTKDGREFSNQHVAIYHARHGLCLHGNADAFSHSKPDIATSTTTMSSAAVSRHQPESAHDDALLT
jgi:hypothetical protein